MNNKQAIEYLEKMKREKIKEGGLNNLKEIQVYDLAIRALKIVEAATAQGDEQNE